LSGCVTLVRMSPQRGVDDTPRGRARWRGAGGGQAVGLIARPGERTHQLIADQVFRLLGPIARPVQRSHDAIAPQLPAVRDTAVLVAETLAVASALSGPRSPLDGSVSGSGW